MVYISCRHGEELLTIPYHAALWLLERRRDAPRNADGAREPVRDSGYAQRDSERVIESTRCVFGQAIGVIANLSLVQNSVRMTASSV